MSTQHKKAPKPDVTPKMIGAVTAFMEREGVDILSNRVLERDFIIRLCKVITRAAYPQERVVGGRIRRQGL